MTDTENPYVLVLDSVLPKQRATAKFGEPEFRRLRKALDGLEEQLDSATLNLDFRTMYLISTAIFTSLQHLLVKTDGNRRATILHFCQKAFASWEQIDKGSSSPELREKLWETIYAIGLKDQFPAEIYRDAIRFLSSSATDESKFLQINQGFDQAPYPASNFVLQMFLATLAVRQRPEATVRVLEYYRERPEMRIDAFLQLYYLKLWDAATLIGEHFIEKNAFSPGTTREIENVLLFMAEQQGDYARQIRLLRHRFLLSGHQDLFNKLKIASGTQWPKE